MTLEKINESSTRLEMVAVFTQEQYVQYQYVLVTTIHFLSNYSRYVLDTSTLSRLTAVKTKTLIIAWLARLGLNLLPYLAHTFTGNYSRRN